MGKSISYAIMKNLGFDMTQYMRIKYSNTHVINVNKLTKDKDILIPILLQEYPHLVLLRGYDVNMKPRYSLDVFISYWNAQFGRINVPYPMKRHMEWVNKFFKLHKGMLVNKRRS